MDLKAKKPFRYRGRALVPGDEFQATRAHARVLVATRRAELGTVQTPGTGHETKGSKAERQAKRQAFKKFDDDQSGKPGGSRKQPMTDELADARRDYQAAVGKRPFSGWSAGELRNRICEHRTAQDQADAGGAAKGSALADPNPAGDPGGAVHEVSAGNAQAPAPTTEPAAEDVAKPEGGAE